jgi:hypothetical protein
MDVESLLRSQIFKGEDDESSGEWLITCSKVTEDGADVKKEDKNKTRYICITSTI